MSKSVKKAISGVKIVYGVFTGETDQNPRGTPNLFFSNYSDAVTAANGKGYFGKNAHIEEFSAVEANGKHYLVSRVIDLDQVEARAKAALLDSAKSKLTEAEQKAVGLT